MRYLFLLALGLASCTATVAEQDNLKDSKGGLFEDELEVIMSRSKANSVQASIATNKADKAVQKKVEVTIEKIEVLKEEVKTLNKENEELQKTANDFGVPYEFLQLGDSSVSYKKSVR
jgi:hypothetical protein